MSGGSSLWYLSRGTGVVTALLLSLTMVLGLIGRTGRPLPGFPRFAITGLHRNGSLLAVVFLAVHIITATVDPYTTISWVDAFIPFLSSYQPLWLGLGALALDMLIAVIITSLIRHRLGYGAWRAVHWLAYGLFPIALIHAFNMGPDINSGILLVVMILAIACVLAALIYRIADALWTDHSESKPFDRLGRGGLAPTKRSPR